MTARPVSPTCLRLLAAVLALAACAPADGPDDRPVATAPSQGPSSQAPALQTPAPARADQEEAGTRIEITVDGQRFPAILTDSAAARDLLDQLPLSVPMTDHGGVEKTGRLPLPLSLGGQEGADPDVGDIGYYAPGQDLVLYYGDQSYYRGIVVLGQMPGQAAERLADLEGPVTATVEVLDG